MELGRVWVYLLLRFGFFNPFFSHQELSLRLAEKESAKLVVATDPDADRLAVAEQQEK